ncbi:MAG: helix-turn-helix domain-containing protein [Xanthomonadaceae bacterium]|jgi:AraC-like DNA-binding protein|nr:helix-turn-helix domain-containing protein [Xanthomonadaceae bacterium]
MGRRRSTALTPPAGAPAPIDIGGPLRPVRGVISARPDDGRFEHRRIAPHPLLADTIEHYWFVRWERDGLPAHVARTLPHPCVHWTFKNGRDEIGGVRERMWQRDLGPRGEVLRIKFRPAGFRPWFGQPLHRLRDRALPAVEVLGDLAVQMVDAVREGDVLARAARLDARLHAHRPAVPQSVREVNALVARLADDRAWLRAGDLAGGDPAALRRLQRLFRDHVGVGPKWVIARYRLHEVLERLRAGAPDLSALAADMGFADAAHLSRDFRRIVGVGLAAYRREWQAA